MPNYGNMAIKMTVVKNLVAMKGLQVAVNFGEGGSEGSPKSGNPGGLYKEPGFLPAFTSTPLGMQSHPSPKTPGVHALVICSD